MRSPDISRPFEINRNYPTGQLSILLLPHWRSLVDTMKREPTCGLVLSSIPGSTIRRFRSGAQSDNPVFLKGRERIVEAMRKAGVPEG